MERRGFIRNGFIFLAGLGLTACEHEYQGGPYARRRRWTPPPHAPAHGHRHRHRGGIDLVFDSALGVYLVLGTRQYYHRDWFYRYRQGIWVRSHSHNGPWREAEGRRLPRALRRRARRWRRDRRRAPLHRRRRY